ncbi:MAG TPA: outer membrane lipoprotein carrier protein LolA, partial [Candidatus Acidoferrales bacterium]|nr:outer membrane lipoprotein carrier protein LolA [Candidatus Acidoferrales bacterium]
MPLLRKLRWIFLAAALGVTGAAATRALPPSRVPARAATTFATARPQARSAVTLDSVLHELDTEAKDFHSLTAEIERTKVTVVVNVKSTETGEIWVHGDKMRLEVKSPDPRTILRAGDTLYIYNPGLQRVEEYNLGKHRELVDQFLLLGFGSSGHDLRKGFLITLLG